MKSSHRVLVALLSVTLTLPASCAPPSWAGRDDGAVRLSREEAESMRAAVQEVAELSERVRDLVRELRTLRTRLEQAEQRMGLREFRPGTIKPFKARDRYANMVEGAYVPKPGARGKKRRLVDHLRSFDGLVIAFWATWCEPCIADEELSMLRDLQGQLRQNKLELVSFAVDELSKVRGHRKRSRWIYPLWQRKDAHLEMLPRAFVSKVGVGLPLFLVLNRDGEIRYYHGSPLDRDVVRELVTAAVSLR